MKNLITALIISLFALSAPAATPSPAAPVDKKSAEEQIFKIFDNETIYKVVDVVDKEGSKQITTVLEKAKGLRKKFEAFIDHKLKEVCWPNDNSPYQTRTIAGIEYKYKDSNTCVFLYWLYFWWY